jgi:hypothetical protein
MQPYLAWIMPLATGGQPDQGLPGQPPGIWPSPGYPSHPIAPGGPPPGIWPSPGVPTHPITIPDAPEAEEGDLALVLVITGEHEPIWFLIDENERPRPPEPTEPEPK